MEDLFVDIINHLPAANPSWAVALTSQPRAETAAILAGERPPRTAAERWLVERKPHLRGVETNVSELNARYQRLSRLPIWSRLQPQPSPPAEVWYEGEWPPGPYLAVVGPRRPSAYAVRQTEQIIGRLAPVCTVISGMAFGIDCVALKTAISAGGRVVAVLPTGVTEPYPRSESAVWRAVRQHGAVASEYLFCHQISKLHFVWRNRLLAYLADCVFVPEAASRSGTLATAKFALEAGTPLAVLPGDIERPNAVGSNRLLAEGAHPVLAADDLAALLAVSLPSLQKFGRFAPLLTAICGGLDTPAALVQALPLSAQEVALLLGEAQQQGIIRQLSDGRFALCPKHP